MRRIKMEDTIQHQQQPTNLLDYLVALKYQLLTKPKSPRWVKGGRGGERKMGEGEGEWEGEGEGGKEGGVERKGTFFFQF